MNDATAQLLDDLMRVGADAEHISFASEFGPAKDEAALACGLANAAALAGMPRGYRVWGVAPKKRKVVGTDFDPRGDMKKGLTYERWLLEKLRGTVDVTFTPTLRGGMRVVIMEVSLSSDKPARYKKGCWLRCGGEVVEVVPGSELDKSLQRAAAPRAASDAPAEIDGDATEPRIETPPPMDDFPDRSPAREAADSGPISDPNVPKDSRATTSRASGASASQAAAPRAAAQRTPASRAATKTSPKRPSARTRAKQAAAPKDEPGWLGSAADSTDIASALDLLNWTALFNARSLPVPEQESEVAELLRDMSLLNLHGSTATVTNLGALVAARDLRTFAHLERFCIQAVVFRGVGRAEVVAAQRFDTGYATAVGEACAWVLSSLRETAGTGENAATPYPATVLRELVANAAAHQRMSPPNRSAAAQSPATDGPGSLMLQLENAPGSGPLIEVFSNRIEVSNAGSLAVSLPRIADSAHSIPDARDVPGTPGTPDAPGSPLAQTLRRFRTQTAGQSGWASILESCDMHHAPVPIFHSAEKDELSKLKSARGADIAENQLSLGDLLPDGIAANGSTSGRKSEAANAGAGERVSVTVRPASPFKSLSPDQRLIATYWHAVNRYSHGDFLTNGSMRERFELEATNAAQVSRLIKSAAQQGLIRAVDPDAAPKFKRYVPYWA